MPGITSLAVWAADRRSGLLARVPDQKYVFAYDPAGGRDLQVSLTMPVRLESWVSRGLHPIFQMNLPEGALLEAIRRAIAKIIGEDDLSILRVTGGHQVGRNRFTLPDDTSQDPLEKPESLDELLAYPDTKALFHELVAKYALRSGISGVQPKVLLKASARGTLTSAGYIIKSWGTEYPCLAANEYFCMTVAQRAGLPTPDFFLADNGGLYIMRRFDIASDGTPMGFEDMCSLQALGTAQKYAGSYERIAKSIHGFVSGPCLMAAREQFFATLVLSVMLRNGDAHLKNFGVLYKAPQESVGLAPVYDLVTTAAYIQNDVPALTLAGTKKWWPRKLLERFALAHLSLPAATVSATFDRLVQALTETRALIPAYIKDHPDFRQVGERMLAAWDQGVKELFSIG